jgi:preprotein translocase subunit SecE
VPCSLFTGRTEAVLNRQTKRAMKRQGGETPAPQERRRPSQAPPHRERTSAKQFTREVKAEMKKVAWPSRAEVVNSTIIVLVSVVFMTLIIFGMDYSFARFVLYLFE